MMKLIFKNYCGSMGDIRLNKSDTFKNVRTVTFADHQRFYLCL